MTKALRLAEAVCEAGTKGEVISVDVAAAKALALAQPVGQMERVALPEARGRILARRIDAGIKLPPFDSSAMDGYAVRLADLAGGGPWLLRVDERIAAGDNRSLSSSPMSAARIFAGAHVPVGYDAVIMQENVTREGDRIIVASRPQRGGNIRLAGEDVQIGACVGEAGMVLGPQRVALLAAQGVASLDVWRKVVAVDPAHVRAHKALGHLLVDKRWWTPEEKAAAEAAAQEAEMRAKGLVPHDGRWVTPREKEALEQGLRLPDDDLVSVPDLDLTPGADETVDPHEDDGPDEPEDIEGDDHA